MDRRDYLKPSRFGNADKRRQLENKNLKLKRSIRRTTNFNLRRDIEQEFSQNAIENVPPKVDKAIDRKLALQKFRAEREALKEALKNKKKPPFIVGIPHHGSSPLLRNLESTNIKKTTSCHEVRNKRITRATTRMVQGNVLKEKLKVNVEPRKKHIFKAPTSVKIFPFNEKKTTFTFQAAKAPQSTKKLTLPLTPTVLKRSAQKKPPKPQSNLAKKCKENSESKYPLEDDVLAAPLKSEAIEDERPNVKNETESSSPVTEIQVATESTVVTDLQNEIESTSATKSLGGTDSALKTELQVPTVSTSGNESSTPETDVGRTANEGIDNKTKGFSDEAACHHERLQSETVRLLELADAWQALVLRDSLPQDVVDEVDSVVGQTRLLTGDKFQQFRRLVVEYQQQSGTRPITLDDLNGFWDMVYLQVESLDKKYEALDTLKNNNWVKPEPTRKKKRRPAKKTEKIETKTSSTETSKVEDVRTPTTNLKPAISSRLLSWKRTRSNSPSPYIAMRLSGIGRPPSSKVQPRATDLTPKRELAATDIPETPKSALKRSLTKVTRTNTPKSILPRVSSVNIKIEEASEDTEPLIDAKEQKMPAVTPRRSMRLMEKLQTPANCSACNSVSCKKINCTIDSASKKNKSSRKTLKFSPSETQQNSQSESSVNTQSKEADSSKPSTSRVRFSLRPSVLTSVCENNNAAEIPKKGTRKRLASASRNTAGTTPAAQDLEGLGAVRRRSPRLLRKVTFESEAEEKSSFKLPATPYRKPQADS